MFVLEGLTVTIAPRFQAKIENGEMCPDLATFSLIFEITSSVLGSTTGSFEFSVTPSSIDTKRISFAGVDPDQAFADS